MVENIQRYLDAAVLKPELTRDEAVKAIEECIRYNTRTVCVRPCDIDLAVKMCSGTETGVSCVLSFPHGTAPAPVKAFEAADYVSRGVNEIDMVANYGFIRSGMWDAVQEEIAAVVAAAKPAGVGVKVIFETCYLDSAQIAKTVETAVAAGADFVKTSTGFAEGGATEEAVEVMIRAARGRIKVKPSGGIRNRTTAERYISMGADRLGSNFTANRAIIEEDGPVGENGGY